MPLNENQVGRILATFVHVDGLLKSIEAVTHSDASPFARERADLTPDEANLLLSFVSLARRRMAAALDRLGIPRPEPNLSARRSASVSLTFSEISLSELDAESLRGYGAVDAAEAEEVTAVAADLQNLMKRGAALLREQDEGGLAEQVSSVAGPAGRIVRALLEISTEKGMTELRPLIAAAAERATSATLDVGVFGRVSAGKSSLINALIGAPVLPVGATPVTAVPVRIGRGPHTVEVRFRRRSAERVSLDDLSTFATEQGNAQNRRDVRSIEVTVPSVPEGLRFLDTPGVGSLASSGSAQAFAWLPRCDLGLVLVAAGTPLGRDETALVSGLRHAGIECRVLLSKADLLAADEVEAARDYVARELRPLIGPQDAIDVRPVSTREGHTSGLERLSEQVLRPLARDHVERSTEALRGRLRRLIGLAAGALEGAPLAGDRTAVEFEKARGAATAAITDATDSLASSPKRVLEEVSEAVAASWERGADAAAATRATILAAAGRTLAAVRESVDAVRARPRAEAESESRRLPPLFDPEYLDAIKTLPPPRLAPGPLRRSLARSAVASLLPFLDESLARYASRLRTWGEGALAELRAEEGTSERPIIRDDRLAGLAALVEDVGRSAALVAAVPRGQA